MLKSNRISYFTLIVLTISLGILSRKIDGIPTFLGDTLYAIMVYFATRMFFIWSKLKTAALIALIFCFCIEFSQRYRAEWIVTIRGTTLGHYALGQGFLWSDLVCYTLGVTIVFLIDFYLIKKNDIV